MFHIDPGTRGLPALPRQRKNVGHLLTYIMLGGLCNYFTGEPADGDTTNRTTSGPDGSPPLYRLGRIPQRQRPFVHRSRRLTETWTLTAPNASRTGHEARPKLRTCHSRQRTCSCPVCLRCTLSALTQCPSQGAHPRCDQAAVRSIVRLSQPPRAVPMRRIILLRVGLRWRCCSSSSSCLAPHQKQR